MANINRVTITGNLTRDPELRSTGGGMSVCKLGVAVNHRQKNQQTGEWEEKPNFFDVTVFGSQGENCATYLSKGRPVAVDGRLAWSSWETPEGQKRSKVEIIASVVQFLGSRDGSDSQGGGGGGYSPQGNDVPADTSDFGAPDPVGVGGAAPADDDDIPF